MLDYKSSFQDDDATPSPTSPTSPTSSTLSLVEEDGPTSDREPSEDPNEILKINNPPNEKTDSIIAAGQEAESYMTWQFSNTIIRNALIMRREVAEIKIIIKAFAKFLLKFKMSMVKRKLSARREGVNYENSKNNPFY